MIAVYIITELIKNSAEFKSLFNLLSVSCYIDNFFSASIKIQVGPTRVYTSILIILLGHIYIVRNCSKACSVHCCLRYAIIIISSCSYNYVAHGCPGSEQKIDCYLLVDNNH